MKKYLIIIFILINCEKEDMSILPFIISNTTETPTTPTQSWKVDGGDTVFLTPDSLGGDYEFTGKGVTCTGLFFKGWSIEGNPQFWLSNEGRDREVGSGGIDPQVWLPSALLIELDYSASGGGAGNRVTATKLKDLRMEGFHNSTIQGIVEANDGTLYISAGKTIFNISSDADINGDAILLGSWSIPTATYISGLAYDYTNDTLLLFDLNGSNTAVMRYSTAGTLLDANVIDVFFATDQLYLDIYDPDVLYVGAGGNGGTGAIQQYSISGAFSQNFLAFGEAQAAEGCSVSINPNTGKVHAYLATDGWYHQLPITDPNDQINAVVKKDFVRLGGMIYDGEGNLIP